jgi:hypothetical protein
MTDTQHLRKIISDAILAEAILAENRNDLFDLLDRLEAAEREAERNERDSGVYLASTAKAYRAIGYDKSDPDAADPAYIGEAVEKAIAELRARVEAAEREREIIRQDNEAHVARCYAAEAKAAEAERWKALAMEAEAEARKEQDEAKTRLKGAFDEVL